MNCCCDSGITNDLKIEGDVGADPIWCNRCGCNLDIEDVPVSNELAEELSDWAKSYGTWIDWEQDKLLPHGNQLEKEFNQRGYFLTGKVKQEFSRNYKITFIPSASTGIYSHHEKNFES